MNVKGVQLKVKLRGWDAGTSLKTEVAGFFTEETSTSSSERHNIVSSVSTYLSCLHNITSFGRGILNMKRLSGTDPCNVLGGCRVFYYSSGDVGSPISFTVWVSWCWYMEMVMTSTSGCCNWSIPIAASVFLKNSSEGWWSSLSGSVSQLLIWGLEILLSWSLLDSYL